MAEPFQGVIDAASTPEQLAAPEPAEGEGLDATKCPKCGADTVSGFGLGMGGGYGPYVVCDSDAEPFCGWSYKKHLPPDAE
jgi:hypothetical protein